MLDLVKKGWLVMLPSYHKLLLFCATFLTYGVWVYAQPPVTIAPRPVPVQKNEVLPKANIRVDSNLVLIPVTVTDPLNRFVTGLEKENFRVFEDKKEQSVAQFSSEDAPLSVGVIFDCSGSMGHKLEKSRLAVAQFFKTRIPRTSSSWCSSATERNCSNHLPETWKMCRTVSRLRSPKAGLRCSTPFTSVFTK